MEGSYRRYTDISWYMWEINRRMALAHNRRRGTKGHLWGKRFVSKVVEDGESLLRVMAYVELNAVRAGIVKTPTDYAWGSVGVIKRALDRGEEPRVFPAGFLQDFPEKDRARAYVVWINFLATRLHGDPGVQAPVQIALALKRVDLAEIAMEFASGEPANWSTQAYGSVEFVEKTLGTRSGKKALEVRSGKKRQERNRQGPARASPG
ncbi:MAG: hypothetical protein GY807_04760 [Gammaproteobacteria bacterium]|nr:hypothetical protein [Gammaproteobacteria bacterium]